MSDNDLCEFDIENMCIKDEEYFYFTLILHSGIDMRKTLEENEEHILTKQATMDYLVEYYHNKKVF